RTRRTSAEICCGRTIRTRVARAGSLICPRIRPWPQPHPGKKSPLNPVCSPEELRERDSLALEPFEWIVQVKRQRIEIGLVRAPGGRGNGHIEQRGVPKKLAPDHRPV